MAAPWESYAQQTGPWSDYGGPGEPPAGWREELGDFASHAWAAVTGTAHTLLHPIDTASQIIENTKQQVQAAREAYNQGDTSQALDHIRYAVPMLGPMAQSWDSEMSKGKIGGPMGDVVGMIAVGKALEAAPKLPGAIAEHAPTVSKAVKAAVQTGGPDVAAGAAKTAAGAVLAKAGPMGEVADVVAGYPLISSGVKQIGRGVRAGITAGREAVNPTPPAPLAGLQPLSTAGEWEGVPPEPAQPAQFMTGPGAARLTGEGVAVPTMGDTVPAMEEPPAGSAALPRPEAADPAARPIGGAEPEIPADGGPVLPRSGEAAGPWEQYAQSKPSEAGAKAKLIPFREPEIDPGAYSAEARSLKVQEITDLLREHGISAENVSNFDDAQWDKVREAADIRRKAGSPDAETMGKLSALTKSQVRLRLRKLERADSAKRALADEMSQ